MSCSWAIYFPSNSNRKNTYEATKFSVGLTNFFSVYFQRCLGFSGDSSDMFHETHSEPSLNVILRQTNDGILFLISIISFGWKLKLHIRLAQHSIQIAFEVLCFTSRIRNKLPKQPHFSGILYKIERIPYIRFTLLYLGKVCSSIDKKFEISNSYWKVENCSSRKSKGRWSFPSFPCMYKFHPWTEFHFIRWAYIAHYVCRLILMHYMLVHC